MCFAGCCATAEVRAIQCALEHTAGDVWSSCRGGVNCGAPRRAESRDICVSSQSSVQA